MALLLAVDLGGTKSRLGLYNLDDKQAAPIVQSVYKNRNFSGIEEVIALFLAENEVTADYASLAVAGIIDGDVAWMTNLSWQVTTSLLKQRFSFSEVFLINDLKALSMSIPALGENEIFEIKAGERLADETIGVIAPGTGLGQGYIVPSADGFIVKGSEGGHSGFTPANDVELDILRWRMKESGVVSAEQICAGPGIGVLYRYYEQQGRIAPADWVAERVAAADDITPVVVSGATAKDTCPVCRQAIQTYLAALGRETANLALKLYARGGVYMGGGVLLHLIGKVSFQPFLDGFLQEKKMKELLEAIPVFGIKKEDALLYGAYIHGLASLSE